MKKNTVKSDFKKNIELNDGKYQIKYGGMMWNRVWSDKGLLCVVNPKEQILSFINFYFILYIKLIFLNIYFII